MTSARNRGKVLSRAGLERLWNDLSISREEIARLLGISPQGVQWRAKRLGLPPRPVGGRRVFDPKDPMFLAMWQANVHPSEMARHFGVQAGAIGQAARQMGLVRDCTRHNSIDLAEFREILVARRLAALAAEERAALRLAEMVDKPTLMWTEAARIAA